MVEITGIEAPNYIWETQSLRAYALLKNTGTTNAMVFYRMLETTPESPEPIDTGVMYLEIEAGESARVPLWYAGTQEWPRPVSEVRTWNRFKVEAWIDPQEMVESTFSVVHLSGTVVIMGDPIDLPSQAPAGAGLRFHVIVGTEIIPYQTEYPIRGFVRITDADTGEEAFDGCVWTIKNNASSDCVAVGTMPNKDLNLIIESGIIATRWDQEVWEVQRSRNYTILLGVAEGIAKIREVKFPQRVPVGEKAEIYADWGNLAEVADTIFSKLYSNGEIIDETRFEIFPSSGRFKTIEVLMPEEEAIVPFRFEVGHDEQGIDVVDDFREFSIEAWNPATLNIDTKPIKGPISVDGARIGTAPQIVIVEAGTHTVGFEDVIGYVKPQPQEVTVQKGETRNILGVYEPTVGLPILPIVIGIALAVGAAFLITR